MSIDFYEHWERGTDDQLVSGATTVVTTPVLSASRAMRTSSSGTYALPAGSTKVFHFFNQNDRSLEAGRLLSWYKGATELGSIRVNASGRLEAYTGTATLVDSDSTFLLAANTTFHFQVKVTIANTGGIIQVKINGALSEIDFTGDTQPGTDTTIDLFELHNPLNGFSYFDDVIVDNTDYLGIQRIAFFLPIANGAHSTWPGTFADVDEVPNDGSSTIISSIVNSQKESFTFAAHGLGSTAVVKAVSMEVIGQHVSAGDIKLGPRISGTDHMGSAQALPVAFGLVYRLMATDPSDSNPWALGDLVPEMVVESAL